MIVSMTGFGKAVAEYPGKKFTIEIRSLNNKGFDTIVKVPLAFRDKEPEIRNLLSQKLERGKIDFYIIPENSGNLIGSAINQNLAEKYYLELRELKARLKDDSQESLLSVVLRMPDVFHTDLYEPEETDWGLMKERITEAINLLDEFRKLEGSILEKDIILRVNLILNFLDSLEPFEQQRMTTIKEKLRHNLQQFFEGSKQSLDENRFEQEIIYYLEKIDITEEKIRLKKHCDYFLETIEQTTSQGKKLGFIAQEMGREINTIGSKANDAGLQKIVVQMKDELEKIKEQLLNIL